MIPLEDISTRIAAVIKSTGLKQADFAQRIHLSRGFVSGLAIGTQKPSDRTISDICREFGVNEVWLRTGTGEMFQPLSRRDRIASFVGNALQDESDSFQLKLIDALAVLTAEDWAALAKVVNRLASAWQNQGDQADAQSSQEESISEND